MVLLFYFYYMPNDKHHTYVLKSLKDGSLYKGMTTDLHERLKRHNSGQTVSTKSKVPWKLVYFETFETRVEARSREKYFKTAAGRRFLKTKLQ